LGQATNWRDCKEGKQAEFMIEKNFPWQLFERIGVYSCLIYQKILNIIPSAVHKPKLEVKPEWYY